MNMCYGHRCRCPPAEATIYSLEATSKVLEKFRSNFQLTMLSDGEEFCDPLELPVDFTKDDLARVSFK